jgi:hypothetical protein
MLFMVDAAKSDTYIEEPMRNASVTTTTTTTTRTG